MSDKQKELNKQLTEAQATQREADAQLQSQVIHA